MQATFDFGTGAELAGARDRLAAFFGPARPPDVRTPMGQLVKSLISNRTYDAVSLAAYDGLTAGRSWAALAASPARELEAWIGGVQFADRKAEHLVRTLRIVQAERPDFDLDFLGALAMRDAFAWLERLPGVGRKVAASALNFSTLRRPAIVIDTHVARILKRVALVGERADAVGMYETVMNAAPDWPAAAFTDLHVWMKTLGQTLCRPNHWNCGECPLRERCAWREKVKAQTHFLSPERSERGRGSRRGPASILPLAEQRPGGSP